MVDLRVVSDRIDDTVRALLELKKSLKVDPRPASTLNAQSVKAESIDDSLDTFEKLKKALYSDKWPEAVNPNFVCNPNIESEKIERGQSIIRILIEEELKDKRFLDFGCGEGYCVQAAVEFQPEVAVGYDLKTFEHWQAIPKAKLSNSWDEIKDMGPYDIILIFDVLDHIEEDIPATLLSKAKSVLKPEGKIYMRCHPWISRHGTHLYHDLNKAYVHLVFTDEELKQLGEFHFAEKSIGVTYPVRTYDSFVNQGGLKVLNKRNHTEKVETFFKIPKIAERIIANTKAPEFPEFQMSLQWVDFVLGNP